jgi:hypothetical protein
VVAESGGVSPQTVIAVLIRALGENCVKVEETRIIVITGDDAGVYMLHDPMTRKVVQHISNRHNVPIHFFYHPEMLHRGTEGLH